MHSLETPANGVPLLLHLKVSHYNEKVRWALDYKGIPHARQAFDPPTHRKLAEELTGSSTFPVLLLGKVAIGDSSRIIEALENGWPDPPLYPSDPDDRRRALELEEFFDEELGPYTRRLMIHHLLPDGGLVLDVFTPALGKARRMIARASWSKLRHRLEEAFEINDATIEEAFEKVHAAGRCFRSEVQPSGYLVGEGFTVADLTLASLVSPVVAPEQFPYPQPQRGHPLAAPVREALAESGILDWALEIYARHRGRSAEVAAG
jgi:glutathione S-transferase